MRRVIFFMTVALVSVLSIDVSKRGGLSKADQKKLRGSKAPIDRNNCVTICKLKKKQGDDKCAGKKRLHTKTEDGTKWCCEPQCEAGKHIVEAEDGLAYCCNVDDINMDDSRLTHKRKFFENGYDEKVEGKLLSDSVTAIGATIDNLEDAYYKKSKEIAGLEAARDLQKELQQEAEATKAQQDADIQTANKALADQATSNEAIEAKFNSVKSEVETSVKQTEAKGLMLHMEAEEETNTLEAKVRVMKDLDAQLVQKKEELQEAETTRDREIGKLNLALQDIRSTMAQYEVETKTLNQELQTAKDYTQKCLDAKLVQQNQGKANDATGAQALEQNAVIKEHLKEQEKLVNEQLAKIQSSKKKYEDQMKAMEENADFKNSAKFKELKATMAEEMKKISETEAALATKVTAMKESSENVQRKADELHLDDSSLGVGKDASPVSVRFRAMARKIQKKIKAMESKCDPAAFENMRTVVLNDASIKGCTDTDDCESWGDNLGVAFQGISTLGECMKEEYDELCGMMKEYKTQEAALNTEIEASREATRTVVQANTEAYNTFEKAQAQAIKDAADADIRIQVIQEEIDRAQKDFELTKTWVQYLEGLLETLKSDIGEVQKKIKELQQQIRATEKTTQNIDAELLKEKEVKIPQIVSSQAQSEGMLQSLRELRDLVQGQRIAMESARRALGENVKCEAFAAMECTKITQKEQCQSKDVAKYCVWVESADEASMGAPNTCVWIDKNSAEAIMAIKLQNDDYQEAFYAISDQADDVVEDGGKVSDSIEQLLLKLNEFEPEPQLPVAISCSRTSAGFGKFNNCVTGHSETDQEVYNFEGLNNVEFDLNNFGCSETTECKKGSADAACVPELTLTHKHTDFNGESKGKALMFSKISCLPYGAESRSKKAFQKWATEQITAAKSEAGDAIPAWVDATNAACLKVQSLEESMNAVRGIVEVLREMHNSGKQCQIEGKFAQFPDQTSSEDESAKLCEENDNKCWKPKAGKCRANYVLNLAKRMMQEEEQEELRISAEDFDAKYVPNICVSEPVHYEKPIVTIKCGSGVCPMNAQATNAQATNAQATNAQATNAQATNAQPKRTYAEVVANGAH